MENWGLMTFSFEDLLYDPANSAAEDLQAVAATVAHEVAHQWTGDLVTMAWWSDLWLNEGFAEYFEKQSIHFIYPSWGMRDQFLIEDQQVAFTSDSLHSTHPVVEPTIEGTSDAFQMFDSVSYSKGGSILRMMEDILTPEAFQSGLQQYIAKFKFNNSLTADLFQSENKATACTQKPLTFSISST